MTQLSLKEFLSNVENVKKVAERKEVKEQQKADYTNAKWQEAKGKFYKLLFPEERFETYLVDNPLQENKGETHEHGKEIHHLQTYEMPDTYEGFKVLWRYTYCPDCKKLISKKGVLINDYENLAYIKWFIRSGNEEKQEVQKSTTKTRIDDIVNEFSKPLFGTKGGVKNENA